MSIAAPVLETTDPNSIATMPITLEEAVTAVIAQTDRAQSAADAATITLEEAEQQAALAEASRIAAVQAQTAAAGSATAAAGSAAAAAATAASIDGLFDAETAEKIEEIDDAKDAGILAIQAVAEVRPAVYISVTASMNLVAGWAYALDATTSTTINLTLPANPSKGDTILIIDRETVGFGPTYIIKRNGGTIRGLAEDMTIDITGVAFHLWWSGSDWRLF